MENEKVYYKHFRNDKRDRCGAHGTACVIAYEDGSYAVGMATCSHLDMFNKKIGRQIALGRARKFKKIRAMASREGPWSVATLELSGAVSFRTAAIDHRNPEYSMMLKGLAGFYNDVREKRDAKASV